MIKFTSFGKSTWVMIMLSISIFMNAQIVPDSNGIVYVTENGSGNGSGWDNATNDLHNAIHVEGVEKVFVAVGNYNVGSSSFIMKNNVAIYGGFDPDNDITDLEHNRIMPNASNTNGSILYGQNTRPVIWNVFTSGTVMNSTAILDGFTITGGSYSNGAGIRNVYASPTFRNLVVRGNNASTSGAGIYNDNSSPVILNSVISGNTAANTINNVYGAGIHNTNNSAPVVVNTTITGNKLVITATGSMNGAGMFNAGDAAPKVYNSIIWNNQKNNDAAASGADIENIGAGVFTLKNSITQGYTTGNTADNNKPGENPLFASTGFSLQTTSPAIDAGDNTYLTPYGGTGGVDLAGNMRLYGSAVDMGTYEFYLVPDNNGIVYVTENGNGNGSSWDTPTSDLHHAIHADGVQKVFVAVGNYNVGDHSFIMKNNVEIYGGFDPANNIKTLNDTRILPSLTINGSVLNGQNARPVIWNDNNGLNTSAVLDGFTVMNGVGGFGSGIYNGYASPTLTNLVIRNNHTNNNGATVYNAYCSPVITNTIISSNTTTSASYTGGIKNYTAHPVITNVSIINNQGEGLANDTGSPTGSSPILTNVLISGNTGRGVKNLSGNGIFTNVTLAGNGSPFQASGWTYWRNSIIWDDIYNSGFSAESCLIKGRSNTDNGNIDATGIYPGTVFTNLSEGDYTLKNGSPAINVGNNTLFTGLAANTKDLAGNPRVQNFADGGIIDLGAYESPYEELTPDANGIIYVNTVVSEDGSGKDWNNATSNLHNAIHANGVQKVFVAVGNYNVDGHSFIMKNNVEIYGGFDPVNGITDLSHNRILPNKTTSEGSVLNGENARPVIWNVDNTLNNTAVLDGFTLKNGSNPSDLGGGIRNVGASPVYRNLVIKNNAAKSGAGIYVFGGSPVFTDLTIQGNTASQYGGGIYSTGSSSSKITNAVIKGNQSSYSGAGLFNNNYSSPVLTNVLFTGNLAQSSGAANGAVNSSGYVELRNVTMAGNTTNSYGNNIALATNGGTFAVANSIVFGSISGSNIHFKQSFLQGNSDTSNGNLDATGITVDEVFNDASNFDYTLKENSPAVNTGSNDLYPDLDENTTDLAGNARIYNNGIIDLGAYESTYNSPLAPDANGIIYVREEAAGTGGGSTWDNATADLHNAIITADVQKIFVAVGNYNVGDNSFVMKNNVEIYGGFDPDNDIVDLDDERILPNRTLETGGPEGSILNGENERPVIWNDGNSLNNSAILDGFTIKNGFYNGRGGGIRNDNSSPVLRNLVVKDNWANEGAGISNRVSSTIIQDVVIVNNSANSGGGIYNENSGITISNSIIKNNSVVYNGGGIYQYGTSGSFSNLIIQDNTANEGGGMFFSISHSQLRNILMTGNTAADNASSAFQTGEFSAPTFINATIIGNVGGVSSAWAGFNNSIVFGEISVNRIAGYSLIQGDEGDIISGNLDGTSITPSQVFANPSAHDYTLLDDSPVINEGRNTYFSGLDADTKDLAGNPRVIRDIIDLGAYENQYIPITPDGNGIVYVKVATAGNGSGNDWDNATDDLHNAIHTEGVQKVFVAIGNYNVGDNSFVMKNNVEIYGGFDPDNNIKTLDDERILPNKTASEGSVLNGENTRPLIWNDDNALNSTALLDGFTLMNGKSFVNGGGMYNRNTAPAFNNLVIKNNQAATSGGGIYNVNAPITLSNTIIKDNTAQYGGGIRNNSSVSVLTNVSITGNSATLTTTGAGGGGIFNENSEMVLTNVLIADNSTNFQGGGFRNLSGNPVFTNVTLSNNIAVNSASTTAMDIEGGTSQLNNSIVYGTVSGTYTAQYSLIEGNAGGTDGNLDGTSIVADDVFSNASDGDYTLLDNSPVINAGNNTLFTGLGENTKDLAGNPRLFGANIDLGAYELQSIPSNCPSSTLWDGFAWGNGEPDFSKKAIIDGELILNTDLEACELEVTSNGNLTIPSGKTFTVNGKITNNATAENFIVTSGGNLIQNEDVENIGEITVIRESQEMVRLDYTLWSSPVGGQQLQEFSPQTLPNRIYTYEGASGYVSADAETDFGEGAGYLFRSPNNWSSTVPGSYAGEFTGVPNNGNVSVNTHAGSYTSIGNPYPSNIDADDFILSNPGISTIYFWNNNHDAGNNYSTCVLYNCVAATGGGITPNGIITTGQGFLVATTDNSVNFDNTMRVDDTGIFSKADQTERHRIWLDLSDDENQGYNQVLVGYMSGATNNIDNQIDGKLFGYEGSALYSIIGEEKFVIQGRALPFEASDVVPLGFRAQEAGTFTISLANLDGLFAEGEVKVYLKDKQAHTIHNLMESDYVFESAAGEFKERFEVVYGTDEIMGTGDLTSNSVQIYRQDQNIVVSSQSEKILSVELYDLQGRNIHRNDKVNANHYQIRSNSKGVLVVKVQTQNGDVLTKKVINK